MTTSYPGTWAAPDVDVTAAVPGTQDAGQVTEWPTVTITAPADEATVSGTSVSVTASASDPDGTIASVQFRVDGTNQGSADSAAPYAITWNSTLVDDGVHIIDAVVTDNDGNTSVADHVTVTVDNS